MSQENIDRNLSLGNVWEITASDDDSARFDSDFARTLKRCKSCLKYDVNSLDGLIVKYLPRKAAISHIYDTDVTIVSTELLETLERIVPGPRPWHAGRLTFEGRDAVTFRCVYRYQNRGTKNVSYYLCPECGQEYYIGFGDRHLIGPVDPALSVFQSWAGALLVTNEVRDELAAAWPTGLEYEKLPIRSEPADDYPPVLKCERRLGC